MHSPKYLNVATLVLLVLVEASVAHAIDSNWTIYGQVRPRTEIRNGYRVLPDDQVNDGVVFISQRTRLGAGYSSDPRLAVTVILQDVRTWGDEKNTTSDYAADNFDVHRAFVDLRPDTMWTLRIGRQGIGYNDERILGEGDWSQQGRAHDAIRIMWTNGHASAHLGWAHHEQGEPTRYTPYTNINNYQDLVFAWVQTKFQTGSASAIAVYDDYELSGSVSLPGVPTERITVGANIEARSAEMHGRIEFYWQTGTRESSGMKADIAAYMIGAEVDRNFGKTNLMLWYDYLSGDDRPLDDKTKVFDAPYATNHRYYGWADYFINIPVDTYGRGLQDLALKLKTPFSSSSVLDVHAHYFLLATPYALPGGEERSALGFEIDAMATIPIMKNVRLLGGYSFVSPTQFVKDLTGGDSPGHWFWTMLDVNIK